MYADNCALYMMTPHSSHHILRYQVNHPAMATKLTEMNAVLDGLVKALPDDTMLLVMGDHGSTLDGDHGTSDIINDSSMTPPLRFGYSKGGR